MTNWENKAKDIANRRKDPELSSEVGEAITGALRAELVNQEAEYETVFDDKAVLLSVTRDDQSTTGRYGAVIKFTGENLPKSFSVALKRIALHEHKATLYSSDGHPLGEKEHLPFQSPFAARLEVKANDLKTLINRVHSMLSGDVQHEFDHTIAIWNIRGDPATVRQ